MAADCTCPMVICITISSPDGPDVEVLAAAEGAEVAEGIPQVYLKVTCWKRSFVLLAIAPMRLATEAWRLMIFFQRGYSFSKYAAAFPC